MLGASGVAVRAAKSPKAAPALISRWEFDESSSAEGVFEDRGPAHALMIHVGTWADLTTDPLVEGDDGTSAYTDGSAYATIPANVPAHDLAALTISFYYQRASASDKHILLAAGNGSEIGDLSIEVLPNGRLRGWHTGQDGVLRFFESTSGVTGTNLEVGTAHRIDLSLGSQGARIYLDGAELTAAAIPENTNGWNNTRVKYLGRWTDGVQAAAVGSFDRLRLWSWQLTSAEIADLEPPQPPRLPLPSSGFSCIEGGGGTLVDLGDFDNHETTLNLNQGGNSRYDARGVIHRIRWLGAVGCGSGLHETSNQFFYRWLGSVQDGGCITGGAIYGNLTKDDDYDGGGPEHRLYPCSDGGQVFLRDRAIANFTVEGFRFHGCWDPIRLGGTGGSLPNVNPLIKNITIKGCWNSVSRDDFIENDTMREGLVVEDCLCGDIISKNGGIFHFISQRNTNTASGASTTDRVTVVRDCLVWSMLMKASDRANDIDGYVVQQPFKTVSNGARFDVFDSVFMFDHISIAGDPLINLKNPTSLPKLRNSSGNVVIWRDLGNLGAYPYTLPPGFTLLAGAEGEDFWDDRVNAWKAAHPNVRRFNKTGIARPYGGTTSIVDVG